MDNQKTLDLVWAVLDFLFPSAQPLTKSQLAELAMRKKEAAAAVRESVSALPDDEPRLAGLLDECSKLLDQERARRQSADARLTTILGLTSIAGTVAFGVLLAQAIGTLQFSERFANLGLVIFALYIALQLCASILAAVQGLERRGYSTDSITGLLSSPFEAPTVRIRRKIVELSDTLDDHRDQNDFKITRMAVAHRAMKNFLGGLLIFSALCAVNVAFSKPSPNNLVEEVRRDRELRELLTGPQGPVGPMGPKGEPCGDKSAPARRDNSQSRHAPD